MSFDKLPEIVQARELITKYNIVELPVDIYKIMKSEGISFRDVDLPDEISGVLDMRDPSFPIILVDKKHHENRQRFSIAHELGHYFLHSMNGVHMDKQTFFRSQLSSSGTDTKEKEANRFAAELLMPTNFLLKDIQEKGDLIDSDVSDDVLTNLAQKYGVSNAAFSIKLSGILKMLDI
jgi:Zn-dependent peptidase ImmA (M78 family)